VRRVLDIESGRRRPEPLTAAQIAERCRVTRLAPEARDDQVKGCVQRLRAKGYNIETSVVQRQGERAEPARYRMVGQ
jgi:hypothetical protein